MSDTYMIPVMSNRGPQFPFLALENEKFSVLGGPLLVILQRLITG